MTDWHRIYGISLADTVTGLPYRVEQEYELSRLKQRLDTLVVWLPQVTGAVGPWPELPDGLTDLVAHNLNSYKSHHESFTRGAALELVSHGVIYAKEIWQDDWEANLMSPTQMRLIAVATRCPQWLTGNQPGQRLLLPGVYEVEVFGLMIRVIVPREVARIPRNALWCLLSGDPDLVAYGTEHYRLHDSRLYNFLSQLRQAYSLEGVEMSYTKEDYIRETMRDLLAKMSPRERVEGLSPRELVEVLSPRELVEVLSPRDRIEGLSPREVVEVLSPRELVEELSLQERLEGLTTEELERYLTSRRHPRASGDANS